MRDSATEQKKTKQQQQQKKKHSNKEFHYLKIYLIRCIIFTSLKFSLQKPKRKNYVHSNIVMILNV